ncbi:heme ABC transporter ATP-binding protein [Aquicoccus sp. SU-CL01552]|uniref:heme ABC transporter ATP-binding protein n=1 Tax=Aquicoccus sp. SU-CL01552 TaxID=3127656 RepID=UPI003108B57E
MQATDITVRLSRRKILHGVDFVAEPGALTAIVGPNGSGKTTFLRALAGEVPHGGRVTLNGHDTAHLKPWQVAALRGVLPQFTPVAFPFTVIEIVRLGLTAGTAAEDDSLPVQALARVGLSGFANQFYSELSGGEQQRVQLARVLTQVWAPVEDGQPRWLLLDEPVSSLDIGHQLQVMELARDYTRAGGGVIAVMHDLNLTAMFADHIVLFQSGRILASGSPAEVLTDETLSTAYGCNLRVNTPPPGSIPFLLPQVATA